MPDYYDRLEAQLCELTARGAHRRRRMSVALPRVRLSAGLANVVALGASVLVAVVVAAAVVTVGSRVQRSHHPHPVGPGEPPVIRNIYPAELPAPSGRLSFAARLAGTHRAKMPAGEVRFYAVSPSRTEMILTASGLRKLRTGDLYAVWLYPGSVQAGIFRTGGWPPRLLGMIEPSVGHSGHLTIVRFLSDANFDGPSKLEITVQSRGSITAVGSVVLGHFVNF
jgi:hypothetical protein